MSNKCIIFIVMLILIVSRSLLKYINLLLLSPLFLINAKQYFDLCIIYLIYLIVNFGQKISIDGEGVFGIRWLN